MLTISGTLVTLPTANAHTPPWTIQPHAYLVLAPDPVGVGQETFAVFWLDWMPTGASGIAGDRWQGFKLEITKPDGNTETLGPYISDPIGTNFALYTPDQVGTYTFKFSFPGQVATIRNPINGYVGTASAYENDTFLACNTTKTLTVQQELLSKIPDSPLPTEYWTRPIEGQNTAWYTVASNWLGGGMLVHENVQTNGIAPNSAHIMWTKPLQEGGVVGGNFSTNGQTYYTGDSYEPRFQESIIMNGRLYYNLPKSHSGSGNGYICVDLRTGEEIFWQNMSLPSMGQLYDYQSMNQHGVIPNGWLVATSGTNMLFYDTLNGELVFNQTGVPSGSTKYGPNGEILRYVLNYAERRLLLWNNTDAHALRATAEGTSAGVFQWRSNGKTANASAAYSWNVSIPDLPGSGTPTIRYIIYDDLLLGSSTTFSGSVAGTPDPWTMWAISLKPATRGNLMWIKNYPAPANNLTLQIQTSLADPTNRVWLTYEVETQMWSGYSMDDGSKLWGPVRSLASDWDYHSRATGGFPSHAGIGEARTVAYGHLYTAGFGGLVSCFDMKDGSLVWTYGNGGAGNSTFSGLESPWGHSPTFISKIADGKIYTFTSEHSVGQPIYKGSKWRCIDAFTGKEIWTISGYSERNMGVVADGYFVNFNEYDSQVYCIGKGPSKLTVTAPDVGIELGRSIMIRGTVTDIAAGTQQKEQASRFPNGVPAVSDNSMSAWMEYVYMQKSKPTNATGVEVTLDVIDANGNYRNIGTTTSDASGFYSFDWTPDIEGKYTVIATFGGSGSYWPSHAETAFVVEAAAPTPTAQPIVAQSSTEMYILGIGIALIIAIAIGFAVTILILKKRP